MLDKKKQLTPGAKEFYRNVLSHLAKSNIPFLIGGTFAINWYTAIGRDTKDIDIFCKPGDYPRILKVLESVGFVLELTDDRWLAKAFYKDYYADIIFGAKNGFMPIDDTWYDQAVDATVLDSAVKLIPPVELIWSKIFRHERRHYDGADVNHMLLKVGPKLDWKRLLNRMESQWEILFAHLITFRFVYPSDRDIVPKWLMEELLNRIETQLKLPTPKDKVCRGYILSKDQYEVDIKKWGYKAVS